MPDRALHARPGSGVVAGRDTRRLLAALCVVLLILLEACGSPAPQPGDPPMEVVGRVADLDLPQGAEQTFLATVTRGGLPVQGATVTINVFLPQGGVRWYVGAPTSAEGRTTIRFKVTQAGVYFIEITSQQGGEVVTTNTGFRAY